MNKQTETTQLNTLSAITLGEVEPNDSLINILVNLFRQLTTRETEVG